MDSTFVELLKQTEQRRNGHQRSLTEPNSLSNFNKVKKISKDHNISDDSGILSNTIDVLFTEVSDESFERMERACDDEQVLFEKWTRPSTNDISTSSVSCNSLQLDDVSAIVEASNLNDSLLCSLKKLKLTEEAKVNCSDDYKDNDIADPFNDTLGAVEHLILKGLEIGKNAAKTEGRLPKTVMISSNRYQAIIELANKMLID